MEGVCGWCQSSECDWKVYDGELHETAARLMSTISRKPRRNHEVRAILRCKYICMKTGSMSGTVPECVKRGLLENWPDNNKVREICIIMLLEVLDLLL
ncbi:hypothetical protein PI124_g21547 [Phytophthora idaei]|nr:hypothetical protein PI125_g23674 [Phytophthora idaei]KAG3129292.1 hypothetical protein PI126_g21032 [Phytophthora idaei]KAG3233378.1 hypothetical protein PI124_g21547 [Phytophthora idaei]